MSTTNSSSLYAIDKLNSSNFTSWKFRMKMILMDRGLWEIVDGTLVKPAAGVDGHGADEWKKKDNTALAQIGLTVGSNELVFRTLRSIGDVDNCSY